MAKTTSHKADAQDEDRANAAAELAMKLVADFGRHVSPPLRKHYDRLTAAVAALADEARSGKHNPV